MSNTPQPRAFEPDAFSDGSIAAGISIVATHAAEHYREYLAGKSGIDWEVERRNYRRMMAARIFQQFGMLDGVVKTDPEIAAEFAEAKEAASKARSATEAIEKGPKATDGLTDEGKKFVETVYDPAERTAAQISRSDMFDLIEARFKHPVVRATNSWVLLSGKSNEHMREDAVMLQRAAAIILENMGEPEYKEDLEL